MERSQLRLEKPRPACLGPCVAVKGLRSAGPQHLVIRCFWAGPEAQRLGTMTTRGGGGVILGVPPIWRVQGLLWTQTLVKTHKEGGHGGKGSARGEVERTRTSAWGLAWPPQGQPQGDQLPPRETACAGRRLIF